MSRAYDLSTGDIMCDGDSAAGAVRDGFATTDRELAADFLRRTYRLDRLDLDPGGDRFTLDHHRHGVPGFAVDTLRIGPRVVVDVGLLPGDTLLVVHSTGVRLACAGGDVPAVGNLVIAARSEPVRMVCERAELTLVSLERARVADYAATMTGIDPEGLEFDRFIPRGPALVRQWINTVAYARDAVLADPWGAAQPALVDQAFRSLAAALLSTFPNTAVAHFTGGRAGSSPVPAQQ